MSWEREYLKKDHDLILKLFGYRCIVCGRPTKEVHEIIPISRGVKSLAIKNRVPLCRKDHTWAHESTNKSIPILQEKRRNHISMILYFEMKHKYPKFVESQKQE